jgi:hypothetical protein
MSSRWLTEDPTFYRIEYMRIAQLMHLKYDTDGHARSRAPVHFNEAVEGAVDQVIGELTKEQKKTVPQKPKRDTEKPQKSAKIFEPLSAEALVVLVKITEELRRLRWYWVGRRPPWYLRWIGPRRRQRRREYMRLAEFLDQVVEPATVVLYYSCLIEEGKLKELPELTSDPKGPFRRSKVRKGENAKYGELVDSGWPKAYLSYLRTWQPAKPRPHWKRPLALTGWLIRRGLGWIGIPNLRQPAEPSYRVRYNVACMFSRLAPHLKGEKDREACLYEAGTQLRLCMAALSGERRAGIAEWAQKDPALTALRNGKEDWVTWVAPTGT